MEECKILSTPEELKTFTDPYRFQILSVFYKINEPATTKQVADAMGQIPAKIHYHIQKLVKANILHLVFTKEINGIIAKFYEPVAYNFHIKKPDDDCIESADLFEKLQMNISSVYDQSKFIFLNELKNNVNRKNKNAGSIESSTLYLNLEDAQDLLKYIQDFIKDHSSKEPGKDLHEFHFFSSLIRTDNNNQ